MSTKINFDKFANKSDDGIIVSGKSNEFTGFKLVSRHVVLQQGSLTREGPATKSAQWDTNPPLKAEGFNLIADEKDPAANQALATAIEVAVSDGTVVDVPAGLFQTSTWAQVIVLRDVGPA